MSAKRPTPWQIAADEVLACMLRDIHLWSELRFEHGITADHFPPGPWRDVFVAVDELHTFEHPVHVTTIADKTDGRVEPEWVSARMVAFSEDMRGQRVHASAAIMKSRAEAYANVTTMSAAIQALQNAPDEAARRQVVGDVISQLNRRVTDKIQDSTAAAIGQRFEDLLEAPPKPLLSTGLDWLDNNTGGFQRQQIWWLAGAYKMRKSTVMRNMAMAALRRGASVTMAIKEGTQHLLAAQFVSMLAVEWLMENGLYNKRTKNGLPLNQLSAVQLLTLRNRYKTALDPRQAQAVAAASREFKTWGNRLRIYDPEQKNGGLSTMASFETLVYRDIQKYGVDVVFCDYMQLLTAGKANLYENVANISQRAQALASETNTAIVMLAQLNEESVKGHNTSHSPGVKGGGDPAATADLLLTTGHPLDSDGEPMQDIVRVKIKLARHCEAGKWHDHSIHQATGLFLPAQPIDLG
ncbi:hypothetical protein GF395_04240 [Candidatus Uhrbacteria bacterium]|nr:hypothetical protein [Candidatus Uhrbacteria bacterium]